MSKDIKDYLHLYLPLKHCKSKDGGCVNSLVCNQTDRCNWPTGVRMFIFPDDSITDGFLKKYKKDYPNGVYNPVLTHENYGKMLRDGYKPILRPLSDMSEEEAVEVFKMCSLIDLSECEFEFGENYETWINANHNGRVVDSIRFVGDNIEMMNNGGSFSAINPVAPVIAYYLSKHFDLFGLIDAGLALNKQSL